MFLRRVVGDSMLPTLSAGVVILVVKARQLKVGDVVVAELNGRPVVKRIACIENNAYFLVGDNTRHSSDSRTKGAVLRGAISGRVVWPRLTNNSYRASGD